MKVKLLDGEVTELEVGSLSATVSDVKKGLQEKAGLAANKQKLQMDGTWLKDSKTLAFYNLSAETVLTLGAKERGGRKKQ